MATFTTQPFHELLDSDKTTPSTVLDSDGKIKQSLHNLFANAAIDDDDTGFNIVNTTLVESGTSPSGKAAYLLTENSDSNKFHSIYKSPSVTSGRYYAYSIDVKRGSGSRDVTIYLGSGGFGAQVTWNLDLDTGEVTSQTNGTKDAAIATELSDGWWTFTVFAEATASTFPSVNIAIADGTDIQYNGDGTSSIYVSRVRMYEASVHVPVERFENTDFATDTDWVKTNWTIGSGVASKTVGSYGGISQAVNLVAGEKYRIQLTVSNYAAGTLNAKLASGSGLGADIVSSENISANGTYVFILTALSSSTYAGFSGGPTFDGDIDNVSITKVIDDGIQNDLDGEDFIETSGSAIYHSGLEYNADGSFRGIQAFEARSNVQKHSYLNDTNWNDTNITMTLNSTVGVDGDLSAHTIDDQNTSSTAYLERIESGVASNNQVWTGSFFVKKTSGNTHYCGFLLALLGGTTSVDRRMAVNTNTGVVSGTLSSPTATRVEDYGDYWRVSMTVTNNATGNTNAYFRIYPAMSTDGTASEDVSATGSQIVYGAQLELGSSPSPYIPTAGSTRSRNSDTLYKPLSEFGFNKNEYSVLVEFESAGSDGADFPRVWQVDNGTNNIRTQLIFGTTNAINYNAFNGSSQGFVNNVVASYTAHDKHTVITSARSGDQNASVDGGSVIAGLDDSATFEDVNDQTTTLRLASGHAGSQLNGYLKRLIIWPKQLTNDTIVAESE